MSIKRNSNIKSTLNSNSSLIIKFCFINLLILFVMKSYRLQGIKTVDTIINSDYKLSYSSISSLDSIVSGLILSPDGVEYYVLQGSEDDYKLFVTNKNLSLGAKSDLKVSDMNYYINNTIYDFNNYEYVQKDIQAYLKELVSIRDVMLDNIKNLQDYGYVLKENYNSKEILLSEVSKTNYNNTIITTTSDSYFKRDDNSYYSISSNSLINSLSTTNSIVYITTGYNDDIKNLAYGDLTLRDVPTVQTPLQNGRILISNKSAGITQYNEKNISKLATSGSSYSYSDTPLDSILCVKIKHGFLYLQTSYEYFWIREKGSSDLIIGENILTSEKSKFTVEDKLQIKMFVVKEPSGMYFWEYIK